MNEITGGKNVPVVYDSVGKDTFLKSLDCLQPRGLMVIFGNASGTVPPFDILITEGLALRDAADAHHASPPSATTWPHGERAVRRWCGPAR